MNPFVVNDWDQAAVIRYLEVIGEASTHLNPEIVRKYDDIPWRKIKNLRNVLIHEYFGIDIKLVWKVLINDIPELKKSISLIMNKIEEPK